MTLLLYLNQWNFLFDWRTALPLNQNERLSLASQEIKPSPANGEGVQIVITLWEFRYLTSIMNILRNI